MVVSGVPEASDFHALKLACFAIEMREALLRYNERSNLAQPLVCAYSSSHSLACLVLCGADLHAWCFVVPKQHSLTTSRLLCPQSMRIGMHCGPVIAGVVGKRKFLYDIWGDAVCSLPVCLQAQCCDALPGNSSTIEALSRMQQC